MIEPIDTDQKTQDKSAQDQLKNLSEMEEASEKGENFLTKLIHGIFSRIYFLQFSNLFSPSFFFLLDQK